MQLLEKVVVLEQAADAFGFRWENTDQIMAQIHSECEEIQEHLKSPHSLNTDDLQEEIGDLMHAVFSLCVFCKLSPEITLEQTLNKFERRLNAVKQIAANQGQHNLSGLSFDSLMKIWDEAKKIVG
mgnify:CR=1 FL=1